MYSTCCLPARIAAFTTRGHVVRAMLEAICFQTREVLEAMILDTAGMQHSASCPDLDPAVLEAAGGSSGGVGGGGGLSRSRLGSASNSMSRLAFESSALSSSSMPPSMAALAPSLQQQQHSSGGGGGVALKARDTSGDGGRVSISSWGSSQQLLGGGSGYSLNLLRVDGGATNNNLLMQLQVGVVARATLAFWGGGCWLAGCAWQLGGFASLCSCEQTSRCWPTYASLHSPPRCFLPCTV